MRPPGDSPAPGIAIRRRPRDLRARRYRRASDYAQGIAWATQTLAHRRPAVCQLRPSRLGGQRPSRSLRALTFARGPGGVVLPSPAPKELQLDAAWPGFNLTLKRLG